MRLCLIPRRVIRNRKQFIAIRRCCQALISWWRSITGLKTSGEGVLRPLGWGARRNRREPSGGSSNEALMRGGPPAFVEKPKEAAARAGARRGHFLPRALSTVNPLRASCGHQAGCPLRALLGPRHPRRLRTAAGNEAPPCNNANALITISSICMKKTR
ncbi:hypothetical protein J1605_000580 [Eschrichtius robustus]|uniref:Uncharacterized protein n=1 Tax=Eschrichtius robustus TaxID=9764 RepID=A0AB34GV07_ESCRO|nr:hypothetical protein J1605_000580 [Eschrichtius robustus]